MLSDVDRQAIEAARARFRRIEPHIHHLAQGLIKEKTWRAMSDDERKICVRYLARLSKTEEEFRSRLEKELHCSGAAIYWEEPTDELGKEARMLGEALGRLVSVTGAMIMFMAHRPDGSVLRV